jgi:Putative polyhydroxyalkanoic acid system protein (PHA_gran_rgn)
MARVDLAVDHGQEPEAVRAKFEQAIAKAQTRFAKWVHQITWADDRSSVRLAGTGFDVELTYDDHKVYVRGAVPIAFKLMQGPVKLFIARALAEDS